MYKLLALITVLALAGCATTGPSGEAGVESREPLRASPGMRSCVIPQGPLSAIQPSELSSQSVTALEPPPELWARIRQGFAMPNSTATSCASRSSGTPRVRTTSSA
jgi:membrane-bound lytic murein transglycosylase D